MSRMYDYSRMFSSMGISPRMDQAGMGQQGTGQGTGAPPRDDVAARAFEAMRMSPRMDQAGMGRGGFSPSYSPQPWSMFRGGGFGMGGGMGMMSPRGMGSPNSMAVSGNPFGGNPFGGNGGFAMSPEARAGIAAEAGIPRPGGNGANQGSPGSPWSMFGMGGFGLGMGGMRW
jgi:hypothetical protein